MPPSSISASCVTIDATHGTFRPSTVMVEGKSSRISLRSALKSASGIFLFCKLVEDQSSSGLMKYPAPVLRGAGCGLTQQSRNELRFPRFSAVDGLDRHHCLVVSL